MKHGTVVMFRGSRFLVVCVVYVRTRLIVGACRHSKAAVSTCCSFLFIYFATTGGERENVIAGEQPLF